MLCTGGALAASPEAAIKAAPPGSAGDAPVAAEAPDAATEKSSVKPGLAGSFLSSRFAKRHEDLHDAAKYLQNALAHDPDNLRLKHELLRASLLAGDVPVAISTAKQLKDDVKSDALVATLLMLDAFKAKQYGEAQRLIAEAPGGGIFGIVRPLMTQWISMAAGGASGAIDMQSAIDKAGFFAPFLTYHVALMQDVLGQEKAAQENYAKANAEAGSAPYRVVEAQANFDARHGRWEEAQKRFDAYALANPDSSLLPDKLTPQATPPAALVGNASEGLAEVFFTTASILFGDESSKDTFLYLRIALELRPEFPPAQLMLANLYEQTGDYPQAIATYDHMTKGTVFYRRGQVRKALNLEVTGKRDEAIKQLDMLSMQYPGDTIALITKGDMLREQEKFKEAAAAYSEAVTRGEPLKENDWPLLYARGISYERAGLWDNAEADFQRALKLEPNQPDVLNYLGYSWLLMNKNLQQANSYLDTALAARPDDPHIIDSAGYAKLLVGDFKTAANYFEKAVDAMPDDATVNEHLGDAYWRLGRMTEAKFQWNRALNTKPDEEQIAAIKAKLANGMPPAVAPVLDAPQPTPPSAAPEAETVE